MTPFPRPAGRAAARKIHVSHPDPPRAVQITYQSFLPLALILWLLPLLAVMMFSIRPLSDFSNGNYWGLPSSFDLFSNYGRVFFESSMPRYLLNSLMITLPTVVGAVALSCMTGFALGIYRFRGNLLIFFMFIAGNFVPFQILMVPVRDLTVDMGLYDTKTGLILFHIAFQTGFCTLFMRNFIRALPYELIEAARVEGVAEWRIFWYVVLPLMKPAIAALAVLIFTFIWNDYFWAIVLTQGPGFAARHRRDHRLQQPVRRAIPPDERGQHRRRPAAGGHVLRHATPFHRRADTGGRQMTKTHLHRGRLHDLHAQHRRRHAAFRGVARCRDRPDGYRHRGWRNPRRSPAA